MNYLNDLQPFCRNLTKESSAILKKYFRTDITVESKADESPVTIADKKTEETLRALINKEFPEHGILGEEFGEENPDADYQWVLDPIDGTVSFISGALSFGTLIALKYKGNPVLGVYHHPILDEFLIGDGTISLLNDKAVKLRHCNELSKATLLTTDILNVEKYQRLVPFQKLTREVKIFRMWGDCYGYYLVATGFADIMIDPIVNPWDSTAIIPIIEGAGGCITDYQGNDAIKGDSLVAAPKELHKQIIEIINEKNSKQ